MEKESASYVASPFYITVILYESSTTAPDDVSLYEESFLLIKAVSEEEAREKALKRANEPYSYQNQYGNTVTWLFKQLVDVRQMFNDNINDGTEIYSRYFQNYEAYRLAFLVH